MKRACEREKEHVRFELGGKGGKKVSKKEEGKEIMLPHQCVRCAWKVWKFERIIMRAAEQAGEKRREKHNKHKRMVYFWALGTGKGGTSRSGRGLVQQYKYSSEMLCLCGSFPEPSPLPPSVPGGIEECVRQCAEEIEHTGRSR